MSGLLDRRRPERRPVVLVAAGLLLGGLLAAAQAVEPPAPAMGALAAMSVMLVGLELGIRGGLTAAGLAVLVVAVGDANVGMPGVAAYGAVLVAVAGVAGRFSARMRGAHVREAALLRSGLELAGARSEDEIRAATAAAALRMPAALGVAVDVEGAAPIQRGRRAAHSTKAAMPIDGATAGEITVFRPRPAAPEERTALDLLAMQAGLSVEQVRLRRREGERAAAERELEHVRRDLFGERSAVSRLLGAQEAERRRVAETLQEQLAQLLAAVLMGLRVLERGAQDQRPAAIDALREQVADVLGQLRSLAGTLRPATVEHLGLEPALRALADDAASKRPDVVVRIAGDTSSLPDALATGTYRIVEDAIATAPGGPVAVSLTVTDDENRIELTLPGPADESRLAGIRSRVELLGGTLEVSEREGGGTLAVARLRGATRSDAPSGRHGDGNVPAQNA